MYDPFERGSHPVGVSTVELTDATRDRKMPVEIWYPAKKTYAGQDLDLSSRDHYKVAFGLPAGWQAAVRDAEIEPDIYPLVIFSHGFASHRRQSTFLCTHLASHGYVVAGIDHIGNTIEDLLHFMMGTAPPPSKEQSDSYILDVVRNRPADVSFVIDQLVDDNVDPVAGSINASAIGVTGHSFGGWTCLATTAHDKRIKAIVPLAPAGGRNGLTDDRLREALVFEWGRIVPTFFIVADKDSILPIGGMYELFGSVAPPKRMIVLKNTDHFHFVDTAERLHEMFRMMGKVPGVPLARPLSPISELATGKQSQLAVRGLTLAHMDKHVKGEADAGKFLGRDPVEELGGLGVPVDIHG